MSLSWAAYRDKVIDHAGAVCTRGAKGYRSGQATFRLHAPDDTICSYADMHFGTQDADVCRNDVYVLSDNALSDLAYQVFTDNWYQKSIEQMQAQGAYGYFDDVTGALEFYDPARNTAVRLLRSPQDAPPWDSSSPVVNLVNWMNADCGSIMLHAACLAQGPVGALLIGPGGSGKSLLTLAGLRAGLQSVGDDYAIVETDDQGTFHARPYSRSGKQSPQGLALLGGCDPAILASPRNWQNKHVFDLGIGFDHSLPVSMTIAPVIAKRQKISPAHPARMYRTLIESTLLQLPATVTQTTQMAARIARERPVYTFEMGGDIPANARYLRDFLTEHATHD